MYFRQVIPQRYPKRLNDHGTVSLQRFHVYGNLIIGDHAWQKINASAFHQFCITDWPRSTRGVIVQVPMRPCLVFVLVIHQLKQVLWNMHLTEANALTMSDIWLENRSGDDENVTRSSRCIFPSSRLN